MEPKRKAQAGDLDKLIGVLGAIARCRHRMKSSVIKNYEAMTLQKWPEWEWQIAVNEKLIEPCDQGGDPDWRLTQAGSELLVWSDQPKRRPVDGDEPSAAIARTDLPGPGSGPYYGFSPPLTADVLSALHQRFMDAVPTPVRKRLQFHLIMPSEFARFAEIVDGFDLSDKEIVAIQTVLPHDPKQPNSLAAIIWYKQEVPMHGCKC